MTDSPSTPDSTRQPSPGASEQLADEKALLRRYAKDRSPVVREELAERFMPLARRLASRYAGGAEPFDDLVQVASVGLVKSIDRFDPARGTAFSTFAVPTILGELKRHFRDRGWSVHVPRDVQERILKVERALSELPSRLGRAPTVADIAARLEVSEEQVLEAMHASQGHHSVSLDASGSMPDGEEPAPLRERLGEVDIGYDTVEYGVAIGSTLADISERDRTILHLRFAEDLTQSEIAERVGISQMHVSRILRATLERLREAVRDDEEPGLAGDLDHEELAGFSIAGLTPRDLHRLGQGAQRALARQVHLGKQALTPAVDEGPDPDVERARFIADRDRHHPVREVVCGAGRDRVAQQHRVREALDREVGPRGERADHSGEHGLRHLARHDFDPERIRGRDTLAASSRRLPVSRERKTNRGRAALARFAADLEPVRERGDQG